MCSVYTFHACRLNIQVEFQKPNKEPIPIFLDDVSPDNTINVLSERVGTCMHMCTLLLLYARSKYNVAGIVMYMSCMFA